MNIENRLQCYLLLIYFNLSVILHLFVLIVGIKDIEMSCGIRRMIY